MKIVLGTLVAVIVVVIVGALVGIFSGTVNVAARSPRGGMLEWALNTTMDHSVRSHASGIKVPPLEDSSLIDLGFDHYKNMCITCHGSPAGGQSEAGIGLNPQPPELSDAAKDWTPAELYWIIKNGVKMTGMPAFGPTHSERELWGLVAFLQKLKTMNPEQYKAFAASKGGHQETGESREEESHHHMTE